MIKTNGYSSMGAHIATSTNQITSDEETLKADDGRPIALVRMVGRTKE